MTGEPAAWFAVRWEMAITREDFLRSLPAAVDFAAYQILGDRVEHREPGRGWRIEFERLADRTIGLLTLARLRVDFLFQGYTQDEIDRFMARIELYYRRGGG